MEIARNVENLVCDNIHVLAAIQLNSTWFSQPDLLDSGNLAGDLTNLICSRSFGLSFFSANYTQTVICLTFSLLLTGHDLLLRVPNTLYHNESLPEAPEILSVWATNPLM